MAHFALVNEGTVTAVLVVNNDVITDGNGVEVEQLGQEFLAELYGTDPSAWVQCSYNATFRGVYPGPGFTWDGVEFAAPSGEA